MGHRSEVKGFYRCALLFVLLRAHLMTQESFRNDLDRRKGGEKGLTFLYEFVSRWFLIC